MSKNKDMNFIGQYPRPDFRRENWTDLNGLWEFEFDDADLGERERWYETHEYTASIRVPFCCQSKLSGLQDLSYHPYVWYRRRFNIEQADIKTILLHFGAVDYHAKVWVNHRYVGDHIGGHTSFCFDISNYVCTGENEIVVRAADTDSCEYPRGKQIWNIPPERCWYTATTGIWQNVWLEQTEGSYIQRVKITPDIDRRTVHIAADWNSKSKSNKLICRIWKENTMVASGEQISAYNHVEIVFTIDETDPIEEFHYWSPENPNLYDVELILLDKFGTEQDVVQSYFGMRKISTANGHVLLNNKPYFQKLVLDQGYWADGLMTPPSSDCFRHDLETVKAMGFNGVRKHQKIEDPRFYYWADVLGVLVWEEMPSCYVFSDKAIENTFREWMEVLNRDYNHPSVITWVVLNESWGVRKIYNSRTQQDYAMSLYYLTKAVDPTRLVSINDGWEQLEQSDICSVHDYWVTGEELKEKYSDISSLLQKDAQGRELYCYNHCWRGQPVILSEFGGLATINDYENGWGYNDHAVSIEELEVRYEALISAIREINAICGFCYTQLTDVMQEVNGLLDRHHKPKLNVDTIREINGII